ncbi:hypothetical protein [Streptomyces tanashiensis]
MNFGNMPKLRRAGGYPSAVMLMAAVCTSPHVVFERKGAAGHG